MDEDRRQQLLKIWNTHGEKLLSDEKVLERLDVRTLLEMLNRIGGSNPEVALAMPIYRNVEAETLNVMMDLVYTAGLRALTAVSFEVTNNREVLIDTAYRLGYKRLLFLDSDTVVDVEGFKQLMETMDRTEVSMVAALVRRRAPSINGVAYNAFMGEMGDMRPVLPDDLPTTGVAFPVFYVGLAVALLDLTKICRYPGPRFARKAEGYQHFSEDLLFCRWLEGHELEFLVDPKVRTAHVLATVFQHPPKIEPRRDG